MIILIKINIHFFFSHHFYLVSFIIIKNVDTFCYLHLSYNLNFSHFFVLDANINTKIMLKNIKRIKVSLKLEIEKKNRNDDEI